MGQERFHDGGRFDHSIWKADIFLQPLFRKIPPIFSRTEPMRPGFSIFGTQRLGEFDEADRGGILRIV